MSTFRQIYEGIERTFWNSLTKKLFSFLLLFVLNLGYLVIWLDRREAVEVALAKGAVAPETPRVGGRGLRRRALLRCWRSRRSRS